MTYVKEAVLTCRQKLAVNNVKILSVFAVRSKMWHICRSRLYVCISELTHEIYRGMNCNLANAKYECSRKHYVFNVRMPNVHHQTHTVSSQDFRSLHFLSFFFSKTLQLIFFVKSQHSLLDFCHLTNFFQHYWFFMTLNPIFS